MRRFVRVAVKVRGAPCAPRVGAGSAWGGCRVGVERVQGRCGAGAGAVGGGAHGAPPHTVGIMSKKHAARRAKVRRAACFCTQVTTPVFDGTAGTVSFTLTLPLSASTVSSGAPPPPRRYSQSTFSTSDSISLRSGRAPCFSL